MSSSNIISKILGLAKVGAINYRELEKIKEIILICDWKEHGTNHVLSFLRKTDLIISPDYLRYFSAIFTDLNFRFFNKIKDLQEIFKEIDPDNRILINLYPKTLPIDGIQRFRFRCGRYDAHNFPEYNVLIKGGNLDVPFKLMRRKPRKKVPFRFNESKRRKIKAFYRKLKNQGFQKVIYLQDSETAINLDRNTFYIIETTAKTDLPNVKNIPPSSYESILYSYYADELIGPNGLLSMLRRSKR